MNGIYSRRSAPLSPGRTLPKNTAQPRIALQTTVLRFRSCCGALYDAATVVRPSHIEHAPSVSRTLSFEASEVRSVAPRPAATTLGCGSAALTARTVCPR